MLNLSVPYKANCSQSPTELLVAWGFRPSSERRRLRELSVLQTHEQGTDAHTHLEARMLATLGMLLAASRILWIIIVVVVVLVLLGFFFRGR
jgi:hypothetical protein